ncbi:MAG: cytochrome c3 family protein [Actinomycetota bacterium]
MADDIKRDASAKGSARPNKAVKPGDKTKRVKPAKPSQPRVSNKEKRPVPEKPEPSAGVTAAGPLRPVDQPIQRGKKPWGFARTPAAVPATAKVATGPGKSVNGQDRVSEEEERRRRIILALWLFMFTALIIIFAFVFYNMFGARRGGPAPSKQCLQCHEKQMARQLGSQYLHEPFAKETCTDCHVEPKTANKGCDAKKGIFAVLKGDLKKTCLACHSSAKNARTKKFVHKPFKKMECTNCHDPHGSPFEELNTLPPQELCVSCHYGAEFMRKNQHQPAQARNCVDCHEPHAADFEHNLILTTGELCYSCHFKVAQQLLRPFKHQPFGVGECTSCHSPHSTDEKTLLAKEYNTLCFSCHPPIQADFNRASHHPLGRAPMDNCGVCHLYHGADYRKLLPLQNTINCYQPQCHPGLQAYFDTSEHNSTVMAMLANKQLEVTCSACHSPHGADYTMLLTIDRYTICLLCHTTQAGDAAHPFVHVYGPPYVDRWRGGYIWCGSCHDFHGSPNPAMRRAIGDDLCLKCHDPADLENTFR